MSNINPETDITDEMYSIIAQALLYREDPVINLKKSGVCPKSWNLSDLNEVYRYILKSEKLKKVKEDYIKLESETLVDDDTDTMMLIYNKLLRDAQKEQKYDVVARILKEIRQLKAIENEQMQFEIVFKIMENNKNEQK